MKLVFTTTALVASLGLLAAGCAHERVGWPPAAADVARINEAAQDNQWLRVEYVRPLPSAELRIERPLAIASVDDDEIGFRTADGETSELPLRLVIGVTVKDRSRGALIGTGIGAAAAAVELAAWWWLRSQWANDGGCNGPKAGIDGDVCGGTFFIGMGVAMVLTGALFGYLISGRRTFHFFGVDR